MSDFDWVDRDRGILTKRDRQFLRGDLDDELNDNQRYQKRYQIRQRIRNAMFDFHIMYRALPRRDISMLWDGTDDWIYRSQAQRQRGDAPPYPEIPLLGRCWRDLIALFVYAQIITGIPEAESFVQWTIEEGVDKAVRRHTLENYNMFREVDSTLDWGTGDAYNLMDYLQHVGQQIPDDSDEAEEYLLDLQRDEYLQSHHVTYLFNTYVDS
ncbi:hypothetical protein [Haloparvum sp. PAK95]|uniref:hypothetical protein n=1 Tax=Haloparvum sp. PAK95 TaxID=3418962 RepID=UPI003D2F2DF0